MRCEQFETRLNDLLDRRGDPQRDRVVATHAKHCEKCRRLMDSYRAMFDGLEELRYDACRIPARSARYTMSATSAATALAACVLLLFGMSSLRDDAATTTASIADATLSKVPVQTVSPRIRAAYLSRQTEAVGGKIVLGTARSLDEAISLAAAIPAPVELLSPVIFPEDGLWRRLGDDFFPAAGDTLDSLRRLLPTDVAQRS